MILESIKKLQNEANERISSQVLERQRVVALSLEGNHLLSH